MSAAGTRVGTTFGKYRITALLGKGGMGEVYQAYDTDKNRTVALKILADRYSDDESFRKRFQRESQAAAVLQEPHVIPIHDWGEIDGNLYIDMRLVPGTTLQGSLDSGPLEPSRAVAIISQIAAALDAAHGEGLIHRDVKPANIIVTPADFAYLVDFGIAQTTGDARLTTAGTHIGSLAYMAPERFNFQKATAAVDVYSLACVLYQALTGTTPFRADSMEQLIAAHVASPPPRPSAVMPSVPASFDDVTARGMAKEPDDRYGSAGALARAAGRALRAPGLPLEMDETARAASRPRTSQPAIASRGRPRWVLPTVVAVSAVLALGAVGVIIALIARQSPPPSAAPSASMPTRPIVVTPPIVTGPDETGSRQSCDTGYQLPTASGFGSRAGRGTPQTSCYFANNVLLSYWNQYGNASTSPRTVTSPGAINCNTVAGASCDPEKPADFLLQCAGDGSNPWIKCIGGQNAVVYLW